jgi:hypothetical protein
LVAAVVTGNQHRCGGQRAKPDAPRATPPEQSGARTEVQVPASGPNRGASPGLVRGSDRGASPGVIRGRTVGRVRVLCGGRTEVRIAALSGPGRTGPRCESRRRPGLGPRRESQRCPGADRGASPGVVRTRTVVLVPALSGPDRGALGMCPGWERALPPWGGPRARGAGATRGHRSSRLSRWRAAPIAARGSGAS